MRLLHWSCLPIVDTFRTLAMTAPPTARVLLSRIQELVCA